MSSGSNRKFKVDVSPAFLAKSLQDPRVVHILDRVRMIDATHDVPYLGGISNDGTTVYIDRRLPRVLDIRGVKVDVWKHIAIHEAIEHALMVGLGLEYRRAHHIATRVEEASLEHLGVEPKPYENRLRPYIRKADAETVTNPPPDLYKKPYTDEKDKPELARLKGATAAAGPGQASAKDAAGWAGGFH